ncbi:UNVERIFIED_CONTAM: hypothetical protein Sangu_2921600 [Sesamum angustifolium]|uniref:Uncharacterized protein n=1 Tax=Sesamum angustifolium TaxID=2727405 RepID=A0AAW2ILW5_9LAMI
MRQEECMVHISKKELQQMINASSRNGIAEYERKIVTSVVHEPVRRQLFKDRKVTVKDPREVTSRMEHKREPNLKRAMKWKSLIQDRVREENKGNWRSSNRRWRMLEGKLKGWGSR